jgi:hypothetical protein
VPGLGPLIQPAGHTTACLRARTNGLATNRPVILFEDPRVAGSSTQIPDTIEAHRDDTAAFIGRWACRGRLADAAGR